MIANLDPIRVQFEQTMDSLNLVAVDQKVPVVISLTRQNPGLGQMFWQNPRVEPAGRTHSATFRGNAGLNAL